MTYTTVSLDFPDKKKFDRLILEADRPPFPEPPASRSLENNPAEFMVGREDKMEKLHQLYDQVVLSGEPKLGFIQGSQGVGKSTLSSYFVTEKAKEGQELFLVPFETSGSEGGLTFKKFYEIMMNNLFKNQSIHNLGYKLVSKLLALYETEFREEFPSILSRLKIERSIYNRLLQRPDLLRDIQNVQFLKTFVEIFQEKFNFIYSKLPSMSPELYLTIWFAIFPNNRPFDAIRALKGNGEFEGFSINDDISAREMFKECIKLIKWVDKEGIIMIVIDHLEAGIPHGSVVYVELFSLLLQLRNLSHILVILSGTFDAFNAIAEVVQQDMSRQIDNWGMNNVIFLDPLKSEEVNQVVHTYLSNFWSLSNLSPPVQNPLYPYSREVVAYLYHLYERDLRCTLENLYDHFRIMSLEQEVSTVNTLFEAFRVFRKTNKYLLNVDEIRIIKRMVLDDKVQDKIRSSLLEMGIYHLLQLLANKSNLIHNVKHEPKIGRKNLKPDIYFETGIMLADVRKIAIEVKVFRKNAEIPKKEVNKTHSLLKDKYVDYIIWVSNKPLNQEKFQLPEDLQLRVGRNQELNDQELAYCGLLMYYNEFWDDEELTIERITRILKLAGLDIELIVKNVQSFQKNKGLSLVHQISTPSIEEMFEEVVDEETNEIPDESQKELPDEFEQIEEIDPLRDTIIQLIESKSSQSSVRITTIVSMLKKQGQDLLLSRTKDEVAGYIREIGKAEGFRVAPASIMFKN